MTLYIVMEDDNRGYTTRHGIFWSKEDADASVQSLVAEHQKDDPEAKISWANDPIPYHVMDVRYEVQTQQLIWPTDGLDSDRPWIDSNGDCRVCRRY
jgi:hypothetical protein